jgi:hypothetical protein
VSTQEDEHKFLSGFLSSEIALILLKMPDAWNTHKKAE